jgi:16S rRNA (guanine527-N7)-methyltransferase
MTPKEEVVKFLEKVFPGSNAVILEKFECYYRWLLEENYKVNLISRKTDPEDVWVLHFLDSILSVGCVDYRKKSILDVGTGGGFPGVPLAVCYPDARVTLLDSTKKKIQSVTAGVTELNLSNCSFLDIRLEEVPEKYHGTFDIVVSRSVRMLPAYTKHLLNVLKNDGCIVLYKSRNIDDAAQFPKTTVTDVGTPSTGERKIVVIKKSECIRQEKKL